MNRCIQTAAVLAVLSGAIFLCPSTGYGRPATIDFGPFAVKADFHTGRDSAHLKFLTARLVSVYSQFWTAVVLKRMNQVIGLVKEQEAVKINLKEGL